MDYGKGLEKRVGALLNARMIITGTSVGAQEHPQFTADQIWRYDWQRRSCKTVQPIEEYLRRVLEERNKIMIDVSAYKLNEEELNKVISGIH